MTIKQLKRRERIITAIYKYREYITIIALWLILAVAVVAIFLMLWSLPLELIIGIVCSHSVWLSWRGVNKHRQISHERKMSVLTSNEIGGKVYEQEKIHKAPYSAF